MSKTPRTDALAAKLEDLKVSGDAAALALLVGCRKIESELVDGLSETQSALETERLRLAACSAAALGYFDGCHDDYRSASLGDVLALVERERKSRDYAEDRLRALELILPLAKGYAAEHRVGSNAAYIAIAEAVLARARESEIGQRPKASELIEPLSAEASEAWEGLMATADAVTPPALSREYAVVPGFPNIREWCRGSPTSIVITFVDDITSEQMAAIPAALMDALYRRHSQGHAEPHPDTLLLDFLEAAWPSMELDVHDHGDASLGLSFDDGRREGSMRADSLRDLLNHLRAHINNPENAQEPKP